VAQKKRRRPSTSGPTAARAKGRPSGPDRDPPEGSGEASPGDTGNASPPRPRGRTGSPKPTGRAARLAAAEAARRRRSRRNALVAAAVVAAVVAVAVTLVLVDRRDTRERIAALEAGGCTYDTRADGDAGAGRNHVSNPTYEVDPPAGGDHLGAAASPGTYTEASLPPDGQVVHALEHGDIAVWHPPSMPEDELRALEDLTFTYEGDVLVLPRASLDVAVAATAWHDRLLCPTFDRDAIARFIETYRDKGPEDLE